MRYNCLTIRLINIDKPHIIVFKRKLILIISPNNFSSTVIYVFIRKTFQRPIEKLLPETQHI